MKTVIIPIHDQQHWHLVVINNLDKAFPRVRAQTGPLPTTAPKMSSMFNLFSKKKIEQDDNKINVMILDSAPGTPEGYYDMEYSKIIEYLVCEAVDKYKF